MNMATKIIMTDHAKKRARERLDIPFDSSNRWAENRLKGKDPIKKVNACTYEYEIDGVTFIVIHGRGVATVKTCYKTINDPIKKIVFKVLKRELRKAKRQFNAVNKEVLSISASIYSQISDETAKLARTTNPIAVEIISARLKQLNDQLTAEQAKQAEAEKEFAIVRKQVDKIMSI